MLCVSAGVQAAPADLADLAARIDYGYYTDDVRAIETARSELARLESSADVGYYRAFAAFRLAELTVLHGGTDVGALLAECAERAAPAKADGGAAEHWLLVAACGTVAGGDGPLQSRRRDQALARARELAPHNPRIPLIEAWLVSRRPALDRPETRAAADAKLVAAVAAFDASSATAEPGWGEPEALAALGESALAEGRARAARDYIERALLLAPDYRFAIELRERLMSLHADSR